MTTVTNAQVARVSALMLDSMGSEAPIQISSDAQDPDFGILTVDVAKAGSYTIAANSVIHGIRVISSDDSDDGPWLDHRDAPVDGDLNRSKELIIVLRCAPGGVLYVVHESDAIAEETERISVSSASQAGDMVMLGENRVQCMVAKTTAGWRVEVPDWTPRAHQIPYTPSVPGDWPDPAPETVGQALDILAAGP